MKDKDIGKNGPKEVSCHTDPKALQLVLLVLKHGGCSYSGIHEDSRDDIVNLLPSLNTVSSFIFKHTPPTDHRELVVKEQVGFDLQTERLTPVNLKFLKFRIQPIMS